MFLTAEAHINDKVFADDMASFMSAAFPGFDFVKVELNIQFANKSLSISIRQYVENNQKNFQIIFTSPEKLYGLLTATS